VQSLWAIRPAATTKLIKCAAKLLIAPNGSSIKPYQITPSVRAHTARGFDNNLQVRCADRYTASGEADALRIIRTVFHRDVANGNRIMFTDNGPICQPA
jgi:hypothetical protein